MQNPVCKLKTEGCGLRDVALKSCQAVLHLLELFDVDLALVMLIKMRRKHLCDVDLALELRFSQGGLLLAPLQGKKDARMPGSKRASTRPLP